MMHSISIGCRKYEQFCIEYFTESGHTFNKKTASSTVSSKNEINVSVQELCTSHHRYQEKGSNRKCRQRQQQEIVDLVAVYGSSVFVFSLLVSWVISKAPNTTTSEYTFLGTSTSQHLFELQVLFYKNAFTIIVRTCKRLAVFMPTQTLQLLRGSKSFNSSILASVPQYNQSSIVTD